MKHINVASAADTGSNQIGAAIAINRMTTLSLISLIHAYKGENFDLETLSAAIKGFRKFVKEVAGLVDAKLYVDSGGYSIITGEIPPYLIKRCIENYTHCLEYCSSDFDFIFSLDIPFNAKHLYFNTIETIEKHNRKSLTASIKAIKENPQLKDKFLFIYHFKTIEHYDIWQRLYKELDLGDVIKHRAIGGMVSLKKVAKIDFAPFIATSYQCLVDYQKSRSYGEEFRIHFLGINVPYDRFLIAFIEKLFQRYLGNDIPVKFTYDTINYRISGFHLKQVYSIINGKIVAFELNKIPDYILQNIYRDNQFVNVVKNEIKTKIKTKKFDNGSNVTPLKVYSELEFDRFFEMQIEENELINIVMESKDIDEFDKIIDPVKKIFSDYENIFKSNTVESILKSLDMLQDFHYWYMNMREDEAELDTLSRNFISKIRLGRMIDDSDPK